MRRGLAIGFIAAGTAMALALVGYRIFAGVEAMLTRFALAAWAAALVTLVLGLALLYSRREEACGFEVMTIRPTNGRLEPGSAEEFAAPEGSLKCDAEERF